MDCQPKYLCGCMGLSSCPFSDGVGPCSKSKGKLSLWVYPCNVNTCGLEAAGLGVQNQPGLLETPSQLKNKQTNKNQKRE